MKIKESLSLQSLLRPQFCSSKIALVFAVSSSLLISSKVYAGPNSFIDARAFAMGGVGVASSHPAHASFFNPALLAITHHDAKDDFGLVLPSLNARFADDEEVVDQLDDFQDSDLLDNLNDAIAAYDGSDGSDIVAALDDLEEVLIDLDGDTVRADAGFGIAVQIPSKEIAVGVFTDAAIRATVVANYTDQQLIADYRQAALTGDPGDILDADTELTSNAQVVAAAYAEAGISFATLIEVGGDQYAVGISPKIMQLTTYEYTANVDDFDEDDFNDDEYQDDETKFNLDLGIARQFGESQQWTVGFSILNLIPMETETVSGIDVDFDPIVKAGVAHRGEWHTLAVDIDLTENQAFGFEDDNQFIAVGAEFDAFNTAQLRLGVRYNFADNGDNAEIEEKGQLTAGLGLSPFGAQLSLSALASDTELGAALEFGFAF